MRAEENSPLVSIIIGVRDMENTIGPCIKSLLAQDYPAFEIIVIDDGSEDKTPEIIDTHPVKLIRTEKKGISHARNLGFIEAEGVDKDIFVHQSDVKGNTTLMVGQKVKFEIKDEPKGKKAIDVEIIE